MKDFINRHPFITFLIVDSVCVAVQNIVQIITNGRPSSDTFVKKVVSDVSKSGKEAVEKIQEAKKEEVQMGFH